MRIDLSSAERETLRIALQLAMKWESTLRDSYRGDNTEWGVRLRKRCTRHIDSFRKLRKRIMADDAGKKVEGYDCANHPQDNNSGNIGWG